VTAPDPDALVLLTACPDPETAALLQAKLQAANVQVVLQGEQHRAMLGLFGPHIEPRLLVKASELERAQALIAENTPTAADPAAPDLTARPDREDEAWAARRRSRRRWMALGVLLFPFAVMLVPVTVGLLRIGPKHVVDSAELGYRVVFPGVEPTSGWGPPGPIRIHADHGRDPRTAIEYAVSCVLAVQDLDADPAERFRRAKEVLERKLGPLAERTVGQGPEAPRELTAEDGRTIVRVVLAGRRTFLLVVTGPTALGPHDTREFFDSFATREASIDG
jgi:hypothetical protein